MRRPLLVLALSAAAAGAASCSIGGEDPYSGDPKCFSKDAKDNTCTSSEGVIYRVVDRDSTGALGAMRVRLLDGPRATGPTTVEATVELTPRGPYDGDVALQQAKGALFIPKQRVRSGDRFALRWVMPADAVKKLDDYPAYLSFLQAPQTCPGRNPQCFVYIRLWK